MCIAAFGYSRDRFGMQFLRKGTDIGTTMELFGFWLRSEISNFLATVAAQFEDLLLEAKVEK